MGSIVVEGIGTPDGGRVRLIVKGTGVTVTLEADTAAELAANLTEAADVARAYVP